MPALTNLAMLITQCVKPIGNGARRQVTISEKAVALPWPTRNDNVAVLDTKRATSGEPSWIDGVTVVK